MLLYNKRNNVVPYNRQLLKFRGDYKEILWQATRNYLIKNQYKIFTNILVYNKRNNIMPNNRQLLILGELTLFLIYENSTPSP